MGTRGAYGIRKGGVDKITYNNSDSYPSGLGSGVLTAVKAASVAQLSEAFDRTKLVDEDTVPARETLQHYLNVGAVNLGVGGQSTEDWYCVLRDFQGDMGALIDGRQRHLIDSVGFLADSLFCEWAYIVNLDDGTLEVYEGFNKNPSAPGRYAHLKERDYNGVALVATYPLDALPENLEECDPPDED